MPSATFAASEDVDGDSVPDLLVSVMFGDGPFGPPTHDELFALSGRNGDVLWSRRLDETVSFGAGEFGPPWVGIQPAANQVPFRARAVLPFHVDGQLRIAWVQNHITWWPSILTVLDRLGSPLSKWVHSGVIYTLATTGGDESRQLLVGGVSNSREAAFLAVLDARHVDGAGPEERGSPFECRACGSGRPERYFVIEPSELILAVHPYNYVQDVQVYPEGIEVHTAETPGYTTSFYVQGIARFSPGFELEQAAWSSGWDNRHRELEDQGKIHHSLESCPYRGGPPRVREWTPEGAWREVAPRAPRARVGIESTLTK
jgi:hypothetical protein